MVSFITLVKKVLAKQIDGVSMGSPLGPVQCMTELEKIIVKNLVS